MLTNLDCRNKNIKLIIYLLINFKLIVEWICINNKNLQSVICGRIVLPVVARRQGFME